MVCTGQYGFMSSSWQNWGALPNIYMYINIKNCYQNSQANKGVTTSGGSVKIPIPNLTA